MAITAAQVNELRKTTGAGMMDCKKALTETEGDMQKAIELLRKKGQKVSEKRQDRVASEGAVIAYSNDAKKEAVLIELNCETDFVARNEDFQALGQSIASIAFNAKPGDLDGLRGADMEGRPVSDHLTDAMGRIGEKLDVSKYVLLSGDQVISYIHPGARVGVLVAFEGVDSGLEQIGKDIAMQIAAMSPIGIDKDDVAPEVIERELSIGRDQARMEKKPEHIIEKIAQGKLNKYFKENTLLNQDFVKDTSMTVGKYVKSHDPNLKVKAFKRFQLGQQ